MERLASTSLTRAERETLIGLLKKIGYKAAAAAMAARGGSHERHIQGSRSI
jgi:hypothetical protein